jgi:hypothetical protein
MRSQFMHAHDDGMLGMKRVGGSRDGWGSTHRQKHYEQQNQ